jgi:hypothetical protein
MGLDFYRADMLRFLDLCPRADDRASVFRLILGRIHNVRLRYGYLALSGPVHDSLKLDVLLSNHYLFRGWLNCWKVIAESHPLRVLTTSDRDDRNPFHYACAGGMVRRSEDAGCHEQLERWSTRAGNRGDYPVHYLVTLSDATEIAFLVESGVNLTLQTGGLSGWVTALDVGAQCQSVDMCAYLVELDVLDADDPPYVLTNGIDARTAMNRRSRAIVHLLLSTGQLNPGVVSPAGDSFLLE